MRKWSGADLATVPEEVTIVEEEVLPDDCPMSSGDTENNVPPTAPTQTDKPVLVYKGSIEDIIFMVYDEDDLKKGNSYWKQQGNLFIIMQMKRVVWIRFSVKMTLRSLQDKLFMLYPDITLATPKFNAGNIERDLG